MSSAYLRVVVTQKCSLACGFCHAEGLRGEKRGEFADADQLAMRVLGHIDAGVRKVKFLGGEPLLAKWLPDAIRLIRAEVPAGVDLSMITSGAAPVERLEACFEAGLDRANMSVHGFSEAAFAARTNRAGTYPLRQASFVYLLEKGRPLKLNYVYQGAQDDADLGALLEFVRGRPAVVAILNDLDRPELNAAVIERVVCQMLGAPHVTWDEPDPYSLPTRRLAWVSGLELELKDRELGAIGPWKACNGCPKRAACREGIDALRLDTDGRVRPCMDRPEVGIAIGHFTRREQVAQAVSSFLAEARV